MSLSGASRYITFIGISHRHQEDQSKQLFKEMQMRDELCPIYSIR
jgi:hypothetical protein